VIVTDFAMIVPLEDTHFVPVFGRLMGERHGELGRLASIGDKFLLNVTELSIIVALLRHGELPRKLNGKP
jgi:hypothetical protein